MGILRYTLIGATLLCSLVAGLLFAFAVVVMPGIGKLSDGSFLRSFQAIDRVIQSNQPLFLLVWMGSVVMLLASALLGFRHLEGSDRVLLTAATLVYLLGVQLPTIAINVPLNNAVQALRIDDMDDGARAAARRDFEPRWNRSNVARTLLSSLTSVLLLIVLLRL